MNNELERIWKEAVVAVIRLHKLRKTEKSGSSQCPERETSQESREYKPEQLPKLILL